MKCDACRIAIKASPNKFIGMRTKDGKKSLCIECLKRAAHLLNTNGVDGEVGGLKGVK